MKLKRRISFLNNISIILVLLIVKAYGEPPAGYYASVGDQTGDELRDILHEVIDDHQYYPYTDSDTDTWDIIWKADEDPNNTNNIIDIYKNTSYPKPYDGSWSREHTWPKSYGFPDESVCNYPYTDCHHLMACDNSYNSSRSNKPFDYCLSGCSEYPVYGYSESNWSSGYGNTGSWEVWDHRKGDIARAMFYMDVRYEGGRHGVTGCSEPDLKLTDNRSLIVTYSSNQTGTVYMGILSTLLEWHANDPVDDKERNRNDVVYSFQGNRNPFVDHPEWVCSIWGGAACAGYTPTPTISPTPTITPTLTPTVSAGYWIFH